MKKKLCILILIFSSIVAFQYYLHRQSTPLQRTQQMYTQQVENLTIAPINAPPFKLKDTKARLYILNLWATWCGPCTIEIPHLISLYQTYHTKGLTVIGIAMDSNDTPVSTFINKYKVPYPITMVNNDLPDFLRQAPGIPTTITLDENLTVIDVVMGYQNKHYFEKMIKRVIN